MFQGGHGTPPDAAFWPVLDAFFEQTLMGRDSGYAALPAVTTQGRDHAGANADFRTEAAWPPPAMRQTVLRLGRGLAGGTLGGRGDGPDAAYTDLAPGSEEVAQRALGAEGQWLTYASEPPAADLRIADAPRLRATITVNRARGQLVPTLFDVSPAGTAVPISRGFLDLRYRNGLDAAEPMPVGVPTPVTVTFKNQDWTVRAGHRIALVLESSNSAWAVPDAPGLRVTVASGSSRLVLPVAP
jgi:predicted acyl esterase